MKFLNLIFYFLRFNEKLLWKLRNAKIIKNR